MSGQKNKLDTVRDSIASLFKRRKSRSKNGGISTPQNVKRVMHITFDSDNQSFDGIPAQWRQYFESSEAAAASSAAASAAVPEEEETEEPSGEDGTTAEAETEQCAATSCPASATAEAATPEVPAAATDKADTAAAEPSPTAESATPKYSPDDWAATVDFSVWESALTAERATDDLAATVDVSASEPAEAAELATDLAGAADFAAAETADEVADPTAATSNRLSHPRGPRELLSLVYDRDHGQFVNLPPHWEERLRRNDLLEPEFQANPRLLATIFKLMDEELRTMRAEGERVESCLYSSLPRRQPSTKTAPERPPHYVFRIEADKSNSSSDWDLADQPGVLQVVTEQLNGTDDGDGGERQRGSYVTVKAVEVPEELDTLL